MSRVLHDAAGYELVRDGRVALQGCEPDCCGDGEPGNYYRMNVCDACSPGGGPFYADAGIWSCALAIGKDCIYFHLGDPGGCAFVRRSDPTVRLDRPPAVVYGCDDILVETYSCCDCCDQNLNFFPCESTYRNPRQWNSTLQGIIGLLLTRWGIDLGVSPPACCCPNQPIPMYGTHFVLERWDRRTFYGQSGQLLPDLRYQARGEFTLTDPGSQPDFVWMQYDDFVYGDHFSCNRTIPWGYDANYCQMWPGFRMDVEYCPDIPYAVVLIGDALGQGTDDRPSRVALDVTCDSLRWELDQTIRNSSGVAVSRAIEVLDLRWEYPEAEPCFQPCGRDTGKVPRPDGPPSFREPIGVQRFF